MSSAVNRSAERENDLLKELGEARALVAQLRRELVEVDHRVANSLHLVLNLLRLQGRRLSDEMARRALSDATARIEAVARLHKILSRQSTTTYVDFGQYLRTLASEIGTSVGLGCNVQAERIVLASQTAMNLAMAINELVTNAGTHAYDGKPGGVIDISCRRDADGGLLIVVADHGPGLPADFDLNAPTGVGLTLLGAITDQLGDSLEATSDNGARFTLRIPSCERFYAQPSSRRSSASGMP
jgi:two-component sensor histidine kinase